MALENVHFELQNSLTLKWNKSTYQVNNSSNNYECVPYMFRAFLVEANEKHRVTLRKANPTEQLQYTLGTVIDKHFSLNLSSN